MAEDIYSNNVDRFPVNVEQNWTPRRAYAVTPDDNKDLTNATGTNAPFYAKALYIGVAGDVKVTMAGDNANPSAPVVFKAVPVGVLTVQVRRVWANGTAATNIIALTD